jgi:phenylalanyl-tRNA synthetase alpha chain
MRIVPEIRRAALGERGGWVENVELIQASGYASVPEQARKRVGMSPGQQNLPIRVTLRSLDCSISKEEANLVYDLVYAKLHQGTAGYFRIDQA